MAKTTPPFVFKGREDEYRKERYLKNRYGKKKNKKNHFDKLPLVVLPTHIQFKGSEEKVLCSNFGCAKSLSISEQLAGNKCTRCMNEKKSDAMDNIKPPYVIKKAG